MLLSHFFVDLISKSIGAVVKPTNDVNNNETTSENCPQLENQKLDSDENANETDNTDSDSTKSKPKQFVNPFPHDLRSELMQRIGGGAKSGFQLKKSTTNVDIFSHSQFKKTNNVAITEENLRKPSDLLKSLREKRDTNDDNDSENNNSDGLENLSFKEKLKLIEQSSKNINLSPA